MTETFEHPDDHADDAHTPAHDEPGYVEDDPVVPDDPTLHDDLGVDEPVLPEPEREPDLAPTGAVWHDDPAADDELRAWLDAERAGARSRRPGSSSSLRTSWRWTPSATAGRSTISSAMYSIA